MISDELLAAARRTLEATMPSTCDVTRMGQTITDDGLTQPCSESVLAGLPCRVTRTTDGKQVTSAGGTFTVTATITMPWGTPTEPGDEVLTGDGAWRVLAVATGPFSAATVVSACEVPS